MFPADVLEKVKKHVYTQKLFFFENRAIYKIMWKKYGTAGQAADYILAHAHCMLGT
jgi:hypothetical protein